MPFVSRFMQTRWSAALLAALAVGWAILAFYLLTAPDPPGSGLGSGDGSLPQWALPTLGHFGLFAGLSVLLFSPVVASSSPVFEPLTRRPFLAATVVVLVTAVYGGGLELYQAILPARYATWEDGMVNFAGAAAGAVFVLLVTRLSRSHITKPIKE
jgi:VanZ family protein